jgi:hypothetical protein
MAMIAITTSNSIRVKAERTFRSRFRKLNLRINKTPSKKKERKMSETPAQVAG